MPEKTDIFAEIVLCEDCKREGLCDYHDGYLSAMEDPGE